MCASENSDTPKNKIKYNTSEPSLYRKRAPFPMSVHKHQCLGPCYKGDVKYTHPESFAVLGTDVPTCPTNLWRMTNVDGSEEIRTYDECIAPTTDSDEITNRIMLPEFTFSFKYFLYVVYKIESIEQGLNWIAENIDKPVHTRMRFLIAMLNEYRKSDDIFYLMDNNMIKSIVDYIKKIWIIRLFYAFNGYVYYENNKLYLGDPGKNPLSSYDDIVVRTNFLVSKITKKSIVEGFFRKYLEYIREISLDMTEEDTYAKPISISDIEKNYTNYVKSKILSTIKI